MEIVQAYATKNRCYQIGTPLKPQGIMLHSIGVPQPNAAVMARNFNQYRPNGQSVCVHAFVQRDGAVYQTLPWTVQAWHCGGSANRTHIGVEMTEPASIAYTGNGADWRDLDTEATETHIRGTYAAAVELFAHLCAQFDLDPLADGVIISHSEGRMRGVASPHADPEHLWKPFGLTMHGFRQDVYKTMHGTEEEEEDMVRYNKLEDVPAWAQDTVRTLMDAGALKGDEHGCIDLSRDMVRGMVIGKRYADVRSPRYATIDDVPGWARAETQRLIDRGVLKGNEYGKLDLSMDMLRTMIVCQRMMEDAAR